MLGLLVLVVFGLWVPIIEINLSGVGGGLGMARTVAEADVAAEAWRVPGPASLRCRDSTSGLVRW